MFLEILIFSLGIGVGVGLTALGFIIFLLWDYDRRGRIESEQFYSNQVSDANKPDLSDKIDTSSGGSSIGEEL